MKNNKQKRNIDYKGFAKNSKKEYKKAPKRKGGHQSNKYGR